MLHIALIPGNPDEPFQMGYENPQMALPDQVCDLINIPLAPWNKRHLQQHQVRVLYGQFADLFRTADAVKEGYLTTNQDLRRLWPVLFLNFAQKSIPGLLSTL